MANHPYPLKVSWTSCICNPVARSGLQGPALTSVSRVTNQAATELPSEAPTKDMIQKLVKETGDEKRKLKEMLGRAFAYGPTLIEHSILTAQLQQNQLVDESLLSDPKVAPVASPCPQPSSIPFFPS
eukprot:6238223-Pyramimonas_sp.AAC.1